MPRMYGKMTSSVAQPSSYMMQRSHAAKFGQVRPWQPTASALLFRLHAIALVTEFTPNSDRLFDELRPGSTALMKATSVGFEDTKGDIKREFLVNPDSQIALLMTSSGASRKEKRKLSVISRKVSNIATALFDHMRGTREVPPKVPSLSAGRSAVRALEHGAKIGWRLVWNARKTANLLFRQLLTRLQEVSKERAVHFSLSRVVWLHEGSCQLHEASSLQVLRNGGYSTL